MNNMNSPKFCLCDLLSRILKPLGAMRAAPLFARIRQKIVTNSLPTRNTQLMAIWVVKFPWEGYKIRSKVLRKLLFFVNCIQKL